jgi:hypothetical protein
VRLIKTVSATVERTVTLRGRAAAGEREPIEWYAFQVALRAFGPAAASAAPLVATYLDAPPERYWWTPTHAALTLWRLTDDAEQVAPVLTAAWHANPQTRTKIAEAATGALAAALQPLFRAEIAANRRFNVSTNSWSTAQVTDDERLLELVPGCRLAKSDLFLQVRGSW